MKTERISIEIMGPDRNGNGGIKVTQQGKLLQWFYHNWRKPNGLVRLKQRVVSAIGKVKGVVP